MELSSLLPPSAVGSAAAAAAAAAPAKPAALLETDPDLEAYLRVAIADGRDSEEGSEDGGAAAGGGGGEGEGGDEDDDDLDLDQYLNAHSAEVEVCGAPVVGAGGGRESFSGLRGSGACARLAGYVR